MCGIGAYLDPRGDQPLISEDGRCVELMRHAERIPGRRGAALVPAPVA